MSVQLSLFDTATLPSTPAARSSIAPRVDRSLRRPEKGDHNLFFAAVPPPRVRDQIAIRWQVLSQDLGLMAGFRSSVLHMSLYGLGFMHSIDTRFVDVFREAADQVRHQPFDLTFTHATTFGGNALVLTIDDKQAQPVQDLAETLRQRLQAFGMKVPNMLPLIRPHITLTYKAPKVDRIEIEPFRWTVDSFKLIDSVWGETRHNLLGSWPLEAH